MAQKIDQLLAEFPEIVETSAKEVENFRQKMGDNTIYVVLDDDPTGTQSVADLPVLTAWEKEDFMWAFQTHKSAVYVMTNSRSLSAQDAEKVNREVVRAAHEAAKTTGTKIAFVSRSDSTLRGHFPLEPEVISQEIKNITGQKIDGIVIVPAFGDAGRITINATHYAGSDTDGYVPVGQTEFAKDATFGYKSSYLPDWVSEKTNGKVKPDEVLRIDLKTIRTDHAAAVKLLRSAKNSTNIVVDSVSEDDLRLLALALIEAESRGSHFVYRVGPPFVRARIGQAIHAPLNTSEIAASRSDRENSDGGLIVVGSHVGLTTRQLQVLREEHQPAEYEIDVAKVINTELRDSHLDSIASEATKALVDGNVIVRTSRKLVTGKDGESSLDISRQVSAAVVRVVQQIIAARAPKFVIAKGGITSSDVASKGLGMRHALVVGPMLPGIVSLWSGQDGLGQGIPYIVFAGNVGNDKSLAEVVTKLSK